MMYKIFQVKSDKTRDFGFMSLDWMTTRGLQVIPKNYHQVWEGEAMGFDTDEVLIESLFNAFNTSDYPIGYRGRSMSVSDVIGVEDYNGNWQYWYCDSYGWVLLDYSTYKLFAQEVSKSCV